jgi:hypothetical protein
MAKKKKIVAAGRIKNRTEMAADPRGSVFAGGTELDKKYFQDVGIAKGKDAIRTQRSAIKIMGDGGKIEDGSLTETGALHREEQTQKKAGIQYGPTHVVQDRATNPRRMVDYRL